VRVGEGLMVGIRFNRLLKFSVMQILSALIDLLKDARLMCEPDIQQACLFNIVAPQFGKIIHSVE
jgi:hypothetical protein